MRIFSYRNRQRLRKILLILAVAAGVFLLFCLGRFIYLQRFLVFTDGAAQFDYQQNLAAQDLPQETLNHEDFPIEYLDPDESVAVSGSGQTLQALSGYYITTSMLQEMEAVTNALNDLEEPPKALLLDMKSIYGNFYYTSSLSGANTASADVAAIEALIRQYDQEGRVYLIARLPSFSDNNFALANQSCGLPLSSGALWMDSNGCYWLDPQDPAVQDYLVAIASELAELGFDEVVFDQFVMPDSQNIVYDVDRQEATAAAAQAIRTQLEGSSIRVSFGSSAAQVAASADRVYLTTDSGSQVESLVAPLQDVLADVTTQIVFCTASRDTRFDGYSLLRPLIEQISEEQ